MENPMKKLINQLLIICVLAGFIFIVNVGSTTGQTADGSKPETQPPPSRNQRLNIPDSIMTIGDETVTIGPEVTVAVGPEANPIRNAFFGDLHVHTTYSFDAFAFGALATPYDAYRYAKGKAIRHPGGFDVQLREPLDFYAVTDHAIFLGLAPAAADNSSAVSKLEIYKPMHNLNAPKGFFYRILPESIKGLFDNLELLKRFKIFRGTDGFSRKTIQGLQNGTLDKEMVLDVNRSAWLDTIKAAEKHNEPGRFTTFIAYEFTTAVSDGGSLHRNVIFKNGHKVPAVPFSRLHSRNPEDLWDWMDGLRKRGIETLAIPHNSNRSNGQMFLLTDWAGNPMDNGYSEQRIRNEPLVEITQIKGASDTHPALSPNDEWADFEIMPYRAGPGLKPNEPLGSYVRNALQRGLAIQDKSGVNPYKFGFVGSSDTHTATTSDDESNYFGKLGMLDSNSFLRGSVPFSEMQAWLMKKVVPNRFTSIGGKDYLKGGSEFFGSAGLAGVWAEENTREAIYNAFRRKETFATSGPRIRVRFFAGFDFDDDMINSRDMAARAYAGGVTMGGDLMARRGSAPKFLVWAMRDPASAALQRVQIIKGWIADGNPEEKVYDVACSDGLRVDPSSHRCPDNGARVNLADCSITADVGDAETRILWTDPAFDAGQRAFYYVRVLENPTCRWSTWDALRAGVEPRPDLKATIQERAWSSPIWYTP
jgi:hypothetical protein